MCSLEQVKICSFGEAFKIRPINKARVKLRFGRTVDVEPNRKYYTITTLKMLVKKKQSTQVEERFSEIHPFI